MPSDGAPAVFWASSPKQIQAVPDLVNRVPRQRHTGETNSMPTCKAAVLEAYKQPLAIHEYPVPNVGTGEALVRVEMAGICGTDVHLCDGELNIPIPVILGHETVGRIEALGNGLEK